MRPASVRCNNRCKLTSVAEAVEWLARGVRKLGTAGLGVFDMFFWKMCRLIESPSDLLPLFVAEPPPPPPFLRRCNFCTWSGVPGNWIYVRSGMEMAINVYVYKIIKTYDILNNINAEFNHTVEKNKIKELSGEHFLAKFQKAFFRVF